MRHFGSQWLHRWLSAGLCLAAMSLIYPELAHADDKEEARRLALKGIELYEQGDHQEALNALLLAETNFHAPPHVLYAARARRELGRAAEAYEGFVTLAQEQLPAGSPQPFLDAQSAARAELAELEPRVPGIRIELAGIGARSAVVTVNGKQVARNRLEFALPLSAGDRTVRALSSEGNAEETVTIGSSGPPRVVKLQVGDAGGAEEAPVGAVVRDEPVSSDATTSEGAPLSALGVAALVVGGASIGVGAVTGALTLSQASDIKATCEDGSCPPEQEAEADSAKTLGTVSTVTFIAGGVLVAAGITVLLIDSSSDAGTAQGSILHLRVGPTGLTMRGTF